MSLHGDNIAFEQLFRRYREAIHQLYICRTGGSYDDSDDLLQETFIKVYLNLDKYNPSYTFGQWIYTIARNTFIDYVRKRRDDMSLENLYDNGGGMSPAATSPTPEESVINSQQRSQIEHHIQRMAPRYRRLIELRFFRDYSYEEIAAELQLPMGTVKTQIHRAREQLCRFITDGLE